MLRTDDPVFPEDVVPVVLAGAEAFDSGVECDHVAGRGLARRVGIKTAVHFKILADEPRQPARIPPGAGRGCAQASDAFWGSHTRLFSFIPKTSGKEPAFAEISCPYCDAGMMEHYKCTFKECGSEKSVLVMLPGGKNKIHVCARLGCPGHVLDIIDMPQKVVRSVNVINYFGAGSEDPFGSVW